MSKRSTVMMSVDSSEIESEVNDESDAENGKSSRLSLKGKRKKNTRKKKNDQNTIKNCNNNSTNIRHSTRTKSVPLYISLESSDDTDIEDVVLTDNEIKDKNSKHVKQKAVPKEQSFKDLKENSTDIYGFDQDDSNSVPPPTLRTYQKTLVPVVKKLKVANTSVAIESCESDYLSDIVPDQVVSKTDSKKSKHSTINSVTYSDDDEQLTNKKRNNKRPASVPKRYKQTSTTVRQSPREKTVPTYAMYSSGEEELINDLDDYGLDNSESEDSHDQEDGEVIACSVCGSTINTTSVMGVVSCQSCRGNSIGKYTWACLCLVSIMRGNSIGKYTCVWSCFNHAGVKVLVSFIFVHKS